MDRQAFFISAAAFAVAASPAAAQSRPAVTVATIANDPLVGPFYAKQQHFFENAGLDATVSVMNNGAAVIAAVAGGSVDFGGSNLQSLVVAYKKGVPIQLVAPAGVFNKSSPVAAIIVPKNSSIMTAKDLEGKVIAASPLKSLSEFAADIWIDKNGGDSSKVKYVEIPFGEMESALLQGRVAAASLTEPYISQAQGTCRVLALPYSAIAPQFLTSAFFTSVAFARAHPDSVAKFASAMRTTALWANTHQAASGEILGTVAKLDPKTVADMSRVMYAERLTPALIQPTIDLSVTFKVIDAGYPASDMIASVK
jgi:NitT/TauT family transport system substrate-binding protein